MQTITVDGVTVFLFTSTLDGHTVVQIDTDRSDRIRVNVNDAAIWDADPETHHHTPCQCTSDRLAHY